MRARAQALTDASLRGCSFELPLGVRCPIAPPALPYLPNLGAHKAGIPSLCNDKLGVRFVKANWMRLLVYTVSAVQYSKCTNPRACARARDSLTRISLAFVGRRRFLRGYPFEIRHIGPFAEWESEREREKDDELCWTPIELSWHRVRTRWPECRCQIEFLPYAASRDKYDRKIFANIRNSCLHVRVGRFAVARRADDPKSRIISCPPFLPFPQMQFIERLW